MTRFLIAFLALLGLAAQAPACPRLADSRPAVGLVAAQRVVTRASSAVAVGLLMPVPARAGRPAITPAVGLAIPAHVLRAPVIPGIDRAHE